MKIRIACCDDEKQQLELYKTMFTNIEMRQDIKLNVEYFLSGNFMLERFQSEKNPFDLVYLDMDMDEEEEYQSVGSAEADPMENRISDESPMGKGLIGGRINEEIDIEIPAGMMRLKILEISK